jgi:hypothetical protein
MADKSSFTPDEWKVILSSPMLAGMAVSLAEPSGLWATLKEGMTGARAVLTAKDAPGAGDLLKALSAAMETSEGRGASQEELKADLAAKTPAELKQQALAKLAQASQILDAKAPAEAAAFKAWLKGVAQQVAEASTTGGFLGYGGIQVTDAEKATIGEVAKALNIA